MKLSPEVERRKSNPYTVVALFVLLGCTLGAVGGVSVLRLWPRETPVIQKTAPLSACSDGQRLAWRLATTGLTGGEWTCERSSLTGAGTAAEPFDILSVRADSPQTGALSTATLAPALYYSQFRTLEIIDGVAGLAPDPAMQCRRTVRDGKSKIVGTYLGECGTSGGDLTIMGFEPAP